MTSTKSSGANDADKWSLKEAMSKAFTRKSNWEDDKDGLLDVVHWGKQIISLVIGISFGLIPLKGLIAILIYVVISTLVSHFYVTSFQEQEEETFGGFFELAKEGFGAAFATFLVSWISVYSLLHFD